jgi:TolA-binding protein
VTIIDEQAVAAASDAAWRGEAVDGTQAALHLAQALAAREQQIASLQAELAALQGVWDERQGLWAEIEEQREENRRLVDELAVKDVILRRAEAVYRGTSPRYVGFLARRVARYILEDW